MSRMADDGSLAITPFNSEQQGPSCLTMSPTEAATPEDEVPMVNIDAALESVSDPKQKEPPTILPNLDLPHDDILVKEKGREQELQGNLVSPSNWATDVRHLGGFKNIISLLCCRIDYLQNQGIFQHQPRNIKDTKYILKIESLIKKHRVSSLDKILSKEKDAVFLRQLLDDILDNLVPSSLDAEKVMTSPSPTNSTAPAGSFPDAVVSAALAAAPSCHRRAKVELPAPIPYDAEEEP